MKVSQVIELKPGIDYKEMRRSPNEIRYVMAQRVGLLCTILLVGVYYTCAIGLFLVLVDPLIQ